MVSRLDALQPSFIVTLVRFSRELHRGQVRQLSPEYLPYFDYFAPTAQTLHEQRCHHDYLDLHLKGRWRRFFHWLAAKVKKNRFRRQNIDGYVHLFKRLYPDADCPSTPTVYRYLDRGLLPFDNTVLPEKLRRHINAIIYARIAVWPESPLISDRWW